MIHSSDGKILARAAPAAYAELSVHRSQGTGFSSGQGISSRGDLWPVFSETALAELVEVYRGGLDAKQSLASARRSVTLRRRVEAGEQAAEALCGSMFRLCHQICTEQLRRTNGAERDDLNSAAQTAVLDAARQFSPDKHQSFSSWAAGWVRRVVAQEATQGQLTMPASWRKVGRAAWGVHNEAKQRGDVLSSDELSKQVQAVLEERLERHLRETTDLDDAALVTQTRRNLTKQGVTGALAKLGPVMDAVQPQKSLDHPTADDNETTLGEMTPGTDNVEEQALGDGAAALSAAIFGPETCLSRAAKRYLGLEGDDGTYRQIAGEEDLDPLELRAEVRRARSRTGAPHAHFAHLAPDGAVILAEAASRSFGGSISGGGV